MGGFVQDSCNLEWQLSRGRADGTVAGIEYQVARSLAEPVRY